MELQLLRQLQLSPGSRRRRCARKSTQTTKSRRNQVDLGRSGVETQTTGLGACTWQARSQILRKKKLSGHMRLLCHQTWGSIMPGISQALASSGEAQTSRGRWRSKTPSIKSSTGAELMEAAVCWAVADPTASRGPRLAGAGPRCLRSSGVVWPRVTAQAAIFNVTHRSSGWQR